MVSLFQSWSSQAGRRRNRSRAQRSIDEDKVSRIEKNFQVTVQSLYNAMFGIGPVKHFFGVKLRLFTYPSV